MTKKDTKSQVLKEFEKSYNRQYGKHAEVIENIKLAIFDEYDDYESCGFDIGCIVHSAPFIKKIRSIIESSLTQQKSEIIEELKKKLPTHKGKMLSRKEVKDVIEQLRK